jgi:hypothetical protein
MRAGQLVMEWRGRVLMGLFFWWQWRKQRSGGQ